MVTDGSPVHGAPLRRFERQLLENYSFLVVVMTVLLAIPYAKIYEGDLHDWDWLLISGALVFVVPYPLSLLLPDRVGEALRELQGRGILRPEKAISAFEYRLNSAANQWANVGGITLAGVMCLAWLVVFREILTLQAWRYTIEFTIPGMLAEMALSIAVGRFIGRGLCYGTLTNRLRAEGITLHPIPNHQDGVAGLGPVGSIYLAHAILIVPFIAFSSFWVVLLSLSGPQYASWRLLYVGLFTFMVALEAVILLRPLRSFNQILLEWKQEMLRVSSVCGVRMNENRAIAWEQQRRFLRERRDRIEQMPTWVLSRANRWLLVGVNALAAAPILFIVAEFIHL